MIPAHPTDVIITGAGLSGLSLAALLVREGPPHLRITLVDPRFDPEPDRTWCFWGAEPTWVRPLVERTWTRMSLAHDRAAVTGTMSANPYHMVRGPTLTRALLGDLRACPRVRLVRGLVHGVTDGERQARVWLEDGALEADWVFQSHPVASPGAGLLQHFGGWEIETDASAFDPGAVVLMDFRTLDPRPARSAVPQPTAFVYVLPVASDRALVEHTVISAERYPREVYDEGVRRYIARNVRGRWRSLRKEYGVLPMTPSPPVQQAGSRVVSIGGAGGMTKPSTGYTVRRAWRQAEQLTQSLTRDGAPAPLPVAPSRFAFYDRVFLRVLERHPERAGEIFVRLFARNPFDDVLTFLDERSSVIEETKIFSTLPFGPFLAAALPGGAPGGTWASDRH